MTDSQDLNQLIFPSDGGNDCNSLLHYFRGGHDAMCVSLILSFPLCRIKMITKCNLYKENPLPVYCKVSYRGVM